MSDSHSQIFPENVLEMQDRPQHVNVHDYRHLSCILFHQIDKFENPSEGALQVIT